MEAQERPESMFKNAKLASSFICPICLQIVKDPMDCNCGHTFCGKCILQWLGREKTCPVSRQPLIQKNIRHSSLNIQNIIKEQDIICPNKCKWEGMFQNLQSHYDTNCPEIIVQCTNKPFGCDRQLKRGELDQHIVKECEYRKIPCQHCGQSIFSNDLDNGNHAAICQDAIIYCELCYAQLPRKSFVQHGLIECSHKMISCNVCPEKVLRKDIQLHFIENQQLHFQLMQDKISQQEEIIMQQNQKIEMLLNEVMNIKQGGQPDKQQFKNAMEQQIHNKQLNYGRPVKKK